MGVHVFVKLLRNILINFLFVVLVPCLVIDIYFFWLQSSICHLSKLKPTQLIAKGEHAEEWGGYFIIGGHERLIRMLQMTRRNYPFAITRASWKKRGNLFSDQGVMIRCVKDDHTTTVSIWNLETLKTESLKTKVLCLQ